MLWGLSPALDLLSEYEKVNTLYGKQTINVLLIGSTDGRHILKTMSALRRHSVDDCEVNFFVMDLTSEFVARQLLLFTIALEPEDRLGIQEKARLWMEIYGNTLLRPVTAKYLMSKAVQMIHVVTNKNYQKKRLPLVDLDFLKYKEVDQLENIFKYWIRNRYSLAKIWDNNLRKSLGTRYDAREGVFDWDYNMKLHEIDGGTRVCVNEYKFWRKTGIAYTWIETEYSIGNPTLAVGIGSSGDSLFSLGYLGDMESGPYFAFGTDSEEKKMLEVRNDVNVRRATDITERNLQRMFHELEHGSPPGDLYTACIDLGLVMMKPGNVDVEKEVALDYEPDRTPEDYSTIPVPNCKVFFLPGNAMEIFPKKAKYKEFFDITFVAQNFFSFLNADIMTMMKPSGCLVVETRKFVISLFKDTGSFGVEVRNKLREFGWEEVKKCHFRKDDHALFKKSSSKTNSEKDIDEQNESEIVEISDVPKNNEQVLTDSVIAECAQLNLGDTSISVDHTSEELEKSNFVCLENVEREPNINETEIESSSGGVISRTSLESIEVGYKEDATKKLEYEEDTAVADKDVVMVTVGENQSDEACSEDARKPKGQNQKDA
ncbi:dynein axonemal assembly factor 3 isoform X1 [Halyomorpha halys]|uniref:dynein axonemal assembly factor 3 isoform X1 n=1 Tax=Halyomorpha halys TaxID=286706 RepID=UPI0006D513AA|nr:dynein assembly factor 3, axonemal isoform X1 [Halyomorpha halys]